MSTSTFTQYRSAISKFLIIAILLSMISWQARRQTNTGAAADSNIHPYAQNILDRFDQYKGHYILSGQQEKHWNEASINEMSTTLFNKSGHYAGIRGYDFPIGGGVDNDAQWMIDIIISDWNTYRVIPQITQHWTPFATSQGTVHDDMFITGDINDILNTGSSSTHRTRYVNWRSRLADDLQLLENAGVPVLWRPFHEAGGNWFWWDKHNGSSNSTVYKNLWNDLQDYLKNTRGLNNLIYIWTPGKTTDAQGSVGTAWYPGDSRVDMLGADVYQDNPNWTSYYNMLGTYSTSKLRAISEQGDMFLPTDLWNLPFTWFMTWHSDYLSPNNSDSTIYSAMNNLRTVARGRTKAFVDGTLNGGLSHGKTYSASSTDDATNRPAAKAFDAYTVTRWASASSDPQWVKVDLGASYNITRVVLEWETAYGKDYKIQVSTDDSTWTDLVTVTNGNGGLDDHSGLNGTGRYVRMYGTARGTSWGYSLWEFDVFGGQASNLAANKTAYSSGADDKVRGPAKAFDGDPATRVSTNYSNSAWVTVDLGSTQSFSRVKINWEAAYGSGYKIQSSNDNATWTDVTTVTGGDGGTDDLTGLSGSGRYVRMQGVTRATGYGYSMYEMEVYQ